MFAMTNPPNKEGIKAALTEALLSDEPFDVDKVVERIAHVPPVPPVPYASRTFWKLDYVSDGYSSRQSLTQVRTREDATLITSKCLSGEHAPCFDLDYSAELIPSSSPGHFHLYLHKEISWRRFRKVLKAMAKAGLVEQGWYKQTRRDGMAALRLPEHPKPLDLDKPSSRQRVVGVPPFGGQVPTVATYIETIKARRSQYRKK